LLPAGVFIERASGQAVSATILGTVTDSSGAVVPGATVAVTEVNTGVSRNGSTTGAGTYSLPYLSPGKYRVEITTAGFKKFLRENVEVTVASAVRVDAALEVGAPAETLEVKAESPLLQTDRAEVQQTFGRQSIQELPFAERTPQAIVGLVAGVTPPSTATTDLEGPQGGTQWRTNGTSRMANNTQVDGVDDNDPGVDKTIYIPAAEMVQEVYVTTSNYNAEFGRAGGAVVNIITRGGTNELHGSLFEFHRDTNLAARNFFNTVNQPKPTFIRNEFGGAIGGPIKRNKTFFFGSYQGRYRREATTTTTSLPVDDWRKGDFSQTPGMNVFDPATGNPDGTGRQAFPGNRIPADRFHFVSKGLLPLITGVNAAGFTNNFTTNVPLIYDGNAYDARIDHNFTSSTRIFAKFNTSRYKMTQKDAMGDVVGAGNVSDSYTVTGAVNLTHGFSPTLLSELRLGYNRYYANVNGINTDPLSQKLGIQNPNPDSISSQGLARIQISGMSAMGTDVTRPVINVDNIFNVVNSWNKVVSRHTLKWGVDIRRVRIDRAQPQGLGFGPRGLFVFNSGTTALRGGPALGPFGSFGNAFAAFLLGATDQTGRTYMTVTPTTRTSHVFTFFHDTFQVTPRITLDLGLRHELYTTIKPRYAGGASNYDPTTNALLVAGIGDVDLSNGIKADLNNFQPRFGISYRMNDNTVVRTGYGLSNFIFTRGFTGGTLSTQFPVIYNVQVGSTNDSRVDGTFGAIPAISFTTVPSNGKIQPAPDQPLYTIPSNYPMPMVHSYNFTIERAIGAGTVWDVGYVGTLGRRLSYNLALNSAAPGTGTAGRQLNQRFGRLSDTTERGYGVNSNYNSLQTNVRKRMSNGLSFTVAYTFSKGLGVGGDNPSFLNNLNIRANYAVWDFDIRHMFVASHVYELPMGKGKRFLNGKGPLTHVVGNWQLNGIFRSTTGTPFTATADSTPCNCPGNSVTADALKPATKLGGVGPRQKWFDITAFAQPGPNRWGTAGRNTLRAPGIVNYDMSLFKKFPVKEVLTIEFRAEFYNLTNTPFFGTPATNVNSATFGEISSASNQRNIQFALRLLF
jgi:hypothetical protein